MVNFIIGVDGGGTKTLGAISREDGAVIAQYEVGSTNHHSNPIDVVRANLGDLISNLLQAAGARADDVRAICLGMAGVDRPEDRPLIQGLVGEFLPNAQCSPVNDGIIALMGGALKPFGIIVISGTGSIAFGINRAGERARAGGWGHILGDEGSGYQVALRALRAVCRSHDGRMPPTALSRIILDHFGFDRAEQLLGWTKEIQGAKDKIAALSRLVHLAHESGDGTAATILNEEAEELAIAASAVAKKLFSRDEKDWEIIVAGGNLRKNESFFQLFQKAIARRLAGISVVQPRREPVEGAVLYAIDQMRKEGN
ncbi:MAG: BadF/BadG/BcrA/BcrD ATPase family protein [Candidatus Sumerlaeaceae bacterium]